MEIINQYKEYIVPLLSIVLTILSLYIKTIRYKKGEKLSKAEILLNNLLLKLMEEAEKYLNYTGEEKKLYVITRVKEEFLNKKININTTVIEEKIEELVVLSNNVNYKKNNLKLLKKLQEEKNHEQ